jgi:hypothetical protein
VVHLHGYLHVRHHYRVFGRDFEARYPVLLPDHHVFAVGATDPVTGDTDRMYVVTRDAEWARRTVASGMVLDTIATPGGVAHIPRVLHTIWLDPADGGAPPPDDVAATIDGWRRLHPAHDVRVWDRAALEREDLGPSTDRLHAAVRACRLPAMRSDLYRLALMVHHGGAYADLKNRPLVSFLGGLTAETRAVLTRHAPTVPNWRTEVSVSFIAGPPGHRFWSDALGIALSNVEGRLEAGVSAVTGAQIPKRLLHRLGDGASREVLVVPSETAWGTADRQGGWMRRQPASYNAAGHWSGVRDRAGLYTDG